MSVPPPTATQPEPGDTDERPGFVEPIPEATRCAGLFIYPYPPIAGLVYEEKLGRLMLFNPHTGIAIALEVPPAVEAYFKEITRAGISGLRHRYGQEHVAKLFEGLAMLPEDWAPFVDEDEQPVMAEPVMAEPVSRAEDGTIWA